MLPFSQQMDKVSSDLFAQWNFYVVVKMKEMDLQVWTLEKG